MTTRSHSNPRTEIFEAIRKSGPSMTGDDADIHWEARELLSDVVEARPPLLADDVVQAFRLRFESELVVGTSCEEFGDIGQLPRVVGRYLDHHGLPPRIRVQPRTELTDLNWTGFETDADVEQDNSVSVCLAEFGIAETGSVVVHSGADMPVLLNFLPLHEIVVVPRSRILPFLDDYAEIAGRLARESGTPRNMCLITGASGTTDIEGVLVKGAHGPKFLHIAIMDEA